MRIPDLQHHRHNVMLSCEKKVLIPDTSIHQRKVEIACVSVYTSTIEFITNNSEHRRTTGEVKKTVRRPSWTLVEGHGVCLNHFLNLASNW